MASELKLNLQSKVFLVGSGRIERQGILDGLLDVGFVKPQVFVDSDCAFEYMAKGNIPDWIFISDLGESFATAKSLAKALLIEPALSRVGLSIVADPKHRDELLEMFSLGAMTYTASPISKASIKLEIRELMADILAYYPNSCSLAVSHLTKVLEQFGMHRESYSVVEKATMAYPWDQGLLSLRARGEAKLGKVGESALSFELAANLNPTMRKHIEENIRATESVYKCKINVPSLIDVLGLNLAMIISPDESRRSKSVEALAGIGLSNAICCRTGIEAWGQISDGFRPDLLIIDGATELPSSSAIVERIRSAGLVEATVIILGNLGESADRALLEEYNAIIISEKYVSSGGLKNILLAHLKTILLPDGYHRQISRLEKSLIANEHDIARDILDKLRFNINVGTDSMAYIEAIYALNYNKNEVAKIGLASAIEKYPDNAKLIGLMGEVLLKLDRPDVAKMMILRALKQTPKSVKRICDLAKAFTGLGEFDKARSMLGSAEKIDKGFLGIKSLRAFLATLERDHKLARTLLSDQFVRGQYVDLINRRAIASIERQETEAAIDLYRRSINDIGDPKHKGLVSLWLNLGLAHLRVSEREEGILALEKSEQFRGTMLAKRASAILKKIHLAHKKGQVYKPGMLVGDSVSVVEDDEDFFSSKLKVNSKLRPGERGCFKIFDLEMENDEAKLAG